MIEARHFVEAARERGFEWYAGVPCSYLTPFINYVLQDPSLHYVSMANEGDAVALIAGVALAGTAGGGHRRGVAMMQNSGLGNAVSPLTSLTWTFRLPQLLIVTWRGQPGVPDEPQHALMGPITPTMLDTMEIRWELFPTEAAQIGPALDRAVAHMDTTGRPYALVMQKGSVATYPLRPGADTIRTRSSRASATVGSLQGAPPERVSRQDALREVVARTSPDSTAVLASTGFCGRELYAVDDRPNHLYMVGSMGCVVPLALGLALARPDLRVVALDGDGAALMRMGAFATVGAYGPRTFGTCYSITGRTIPRADRLPCPRMSRSRRSRRLAVMRPRSKPTLWGTFPNGSSGRRSTGHASRACGYGPEPPRTCHVPPSRRSTSRHA